MKKIKWWASIVLVGFVMACVEKDYMSMESNISEIEPGLKSATIKPRIKGFVLRGDVVGEVGSRNGFDNPNTSTYDFGGYVDGIVVQAEWAHLQPQQGGPISENNIIDQAIEAVQLWNSSHPENKIYIKLRIFSGIYSPSWVASATNGFMVYYKNNAQGMLPKYWWANAYRPLWEDFQNKLAAKYDNRNVIREVAVSGVMTHHAETMWRNPSDDDARPDGKTNIQVMIENGLTMAKDEAALKWQINAAANAWKNTHISLAMNMWKDYENNWANKPQFVEELIDHVILTCGSQGIIGNNSIGLSDVNSNDAFDSGDVLYYLRKANSEKGAKIYVQTETIANNIHLAINYAELQVGAKMAELPKLKEMEKYQPGYLQSTNMQNARTTLKD